MKIPDKKLLNAAMEYIQVYIRFIRWDNYEDLESIEKWKHTFSILKEDTEFENIDIINFIKTYLPDKIYKNIVEVENENGEKFSMDKLELIAEHFAYGKFIKEFP